MTQPRDWKAISVDELDQLAQSILRDAVEFINQNYSVAGTELNERLLNEDVLAQASSEFDTMVNAYASTQYFDIREDDREMAQEARDTAAKLKKVIELMRSIPERQAARYRRNKTLPTFLFAPHFFDVLDHAVQRFDDWAKIAPGRRPRWEIDLAAEQVVAATKILLGRPFKHDLQTAGNKEFVNLDAVLAQKVLAHLDPFITRENVKSALLNVLSTKSSSGNTT